MSVELMVIDIINLVKLKGIRNILGYIEKHERIKISFKSVVL